MARIERPAIAFDDEDEQRLHLTRSRSGRLLVTIFDRRNRADFRQVALRPSQADALATFLATHPADPGSSKGSTGKPTRLSSRQVEMLRAILEADAPHLLPLVPRLADGEATEDDEADRLEDALVDAMTSDYDSETGLSTRGNELDDLIGICRQHARSFFQDRRYS